MDIGRLSRKSLTPAKAVVVTTIHKHGGMVSLKFINKKGTFRWQEQCETCQYSGKVQAGLGYHIEPTCDRDGTTWRRMKGIAKKECKLWKGKDEFETRL